MNQPVAGIEALAAARSHFPALERWTYMDIAGRSVLSHEVRQAIDAHLHERMMNGATSKEAFFDLVERARGRFARLVNAQPGEVAYAKNISEALNMIAAGLDWQRGDNVVLCLELEHPNNVYPWLNLQRYGVEVRAVGSRDGHIPVDAMAARMDGRTRVATVSTVTFAPGFRTDVATIGKACRERGVLLLVDAAQSVGVLHTDVVESNIDALAVSTQKGLLALYGMGFLYCRKEWAERLHPAYLARFGVDLGGAHEATMGDTSFKLAPGARRFDLGNYNFLATAAVDASMQQLLAWDTREIERHVTSLAHALAQGFLDLGLPVAGGAPGPHLANIVTVGVLSEDHYGTGEALYDRLYEYLVASGVKLSIRRGMLRFSLHVYNSMEDVARVLRLTRQFLAGARGRDTTTTVKKEANR
ncbi:MAG: aminotransferase class V-fold PLP-dependent enzyme [Betaproteobacteria bacterium]|nr:aminotransferase class V-fold PLP-dependent enzyme [Betaproteobacteria bacterium]